MPRSWIDGKWVDPVDKDAPKDYTGKKFDFGTYKYGDMEILCKGNSLMDLL